MTRGAAAPSPKTRRWRDCSRTQLVTKPRTSYASANTNAGLNSQCAPVSASRHLRVAPLRRSGRRRQRRLERPAFGPARVRGPVVADPSGPRFCAARRLWVRAGRAPLLATSRDARDGYDAPRPKRPQGPSRQLRGTRVAWTSVCGDATIPAVAGPRRLTAAPPVAAQARSGHHLAAGLDQQGSRDLAGPPLECSSPAAEMLGASARSQERGTWPAAGWRATGGRSSHALKGGSYVRCPSVGRCRRSMSAVRPLVDVAGRPRSPATMPGFHAGRAPRNKGQRYPADPPTVDEIVSVMRQARQVRYGARLNGLIVVLWRAGLRIHEALSLMESDLDPRRGSILIKHRKGNRRCEVGMDAWAWAAIEPVVGRAREAACRSAVLRDRRSDAWPSLVRERRPAGAPSHRAPGRRAPPLSSTPLGRPHGYADEDEKVFACWDVGGE